MQSCQCKFCLPPSTNMLFNDIEKLSFQDAFISVVTYCTMIKAKSVVHFMLLWKTKIQVRIVSVSLRKKKSWIWGSKQHQGLSVILNENLAQDFYSADVIPWTPFLHPLPFLFPLCVLRYLCLFSLLYCSPGVCVSSFAFPFNFLFLVLLTFLFGRVTAATASMLFSFTIRL